MPDVEVGLAADLSHDGDLIVVEALGRQIVVARWKGELFAMRNVCPHQSASFAKGGVHGRVVVRDNIEEIDVDEGQPLLRCPWHGWDFSLRNGDCVVDPNLRVRTYRTSVRGSKVFVAVGRDPGA
jgi:3-phenylpropionate/trans-cinnamate dioxygenase ferredoxin subunit